MQKLTFFRFLNTKKGWVFLLILFTSGFLLLTDDKRAGIPYLREVILIFLVIYVVYKGLLQRFFYGQSFEWLVFFYVGFFVFLSAFFAMTFHGQPFFYGVFEERRVLLFLAFFPIYWVLRSGICTVDDIVNYIIYSLFMCFLVGGLYRLNVIPDNIAPSFAVNFSDGSDSFDLRAQTRYMIGTVWLSVVYIYSLLKVRESFIFFCSLN
ncbi:hypothetical protein [Amphritea sp.]|uniref:hypothetical protein n=1 Tax=Amphritea sp. TaxID=1872502 RepID=UPI003A931AA2